MDVPPEMGVGEDDELPVLAGAARPWLSITGILTLFCVFLVSLVGIILFSLYLYFLQAKLQCPTCKVAEVIGKKKKVTSSTTADELLLQPRRKPQASEQLGDETGGKRLSRIRGGSAARSAAGYASLCTPIAVPGSMVGSMVGVVVKVGQNRTSSYD